MILMLDHYDSFTYTLVHYLKKLGAVVICKRPHEISLTEIEMLKPSHIILSPGPGHPLEAELSLAILDTYKNRLPILGVCLGHQIIGAYFGATISAADLRHGQTSNVFHYNKSLFTNIASPFTAMRYHSLCIELNSLPDCLELLAWTGTAEKPETIMAIGHNSLPIFGVQFHPESILSEHGYAILQGFLTSKK